MNTKLATKVPALAMATLLTTSSVEVAFAQSSTCGLLAQEKRQVAMMASRYIIQNPIATTCAMVTMGAVVGTLVDGMDADARQALQVGGVLCGIYCIGNSDACVSAASYILPLAVRHRQVDAAWRNANCVD